MCFALTISLSYAIVIWDGIIKTGLQILEVVVNTLIKIIHHADRLYSTIKLYNDFGILMF